MKTSKKTFLPISILFVIGLACNAISQPPSSSNPSTNNTEIPPAIIATQESQLFTQLAPQATPSPCGEENWKVYPSAAYQSELEDGWKLLIVEFVVENGGEHWGRASISRSMVSVTTEDGFKYEPFDNWLKVPPTPQSPFAGTTFYQPLYIDTHLIPPSFTVAGWVDTGVASGEINRYAFGFKIAQNQQHPIINIEKVSGYCKLEGDEIGSFIIAPNSTPIEDIHQAILPTAETDNSFTNLGEPIEIPNLGKLNFTSIQRISNSVIIKFQFTNASSGYDASGQFNGYIVGEDGLFRSFDCEIVSCFNPGGFKAGPGQTVDAEDIGFLVPETLQNLKFLWVDEQQDIYQVYNLVP